MPMRIPSIVRPDRSRCVRTASKPVRSVSHQLIAGHRRGCGQCAVRPTGDIALMSDEDDRSASLMQVVEQAEDVVGGDRVEVSGGFVSQDERRIGHECAGDGHPLLLAAGEFGRTVLDPVGEPHSIQGCQRACLTFRTRDAGVAERKFDIAPGVQGRAAG